MIYCLTLPYGLNEIVFEILAYFDVYRKVRKRAR